MRSLSTALVCLAVLTTAALGAVWGHYENARFGYAIDIPPDYVGEGESQNGDGQMFRSRDGTQALRVFGGNALRGFEQHAADAMRFARENGWSLSYERTTPSWASYSGTRNGMVLYARSISLCGGDQFASFELTYPERVLAEMNSIIDRLVRSLEATDGDAGC